MLILPDTTGTRLGGLILLFISSMGLGERSYYLYEIENLEATAVANSRSVCLTGLLSIAGFRRS